MNGEYTHANIKVIPKPKFMEIAEPMFGKDDCTIDRGQKCTGVNHYLDPYCHECIKGIMDRMLPQGVDE